MAGPIRRSSNDRSLDILSEAQLQDIERRMRQDEEYYQRNGVNPPPLPNNSPLVDPVEDYYYMHNVARRVTEEREKYEQRDKEIAQKKLKERENELKQQGPIFDLDI